MSRSKLATLFVVVMVLVFPALGGAAGQTTVTSVYTVDGQAVLGLDTGLVLTDGMSVTATAAGAVCAGNSLCPGPNGDASYDTANSSYGGFVLPGAPAWGLVGRVGNGPWVQVGSGPTTLSGTGALVFSANDDYFWDNRELYGNVTRRPYCRPRASPAGVTETRSTRMSGPRVASTPAIRATDTETPTIRMPGRRVSSTSRTTEARRAGTLRPTATASTLPATLLTPHRTAKTRSRTSESLRLPRPGEGNAARENSH